MSVAQITANSANISTVQSWTSILQQLSPDKLYINAYAVEQISGGEAHYPLQSILFDSSYWDGCCDNIPLSLLQKAYAKQQEILDELASFGATALEVVFESHPAKYYLKTCQQ